MRIKPITFILALTFLFSGCAQLQQLTNFSKCEFRTTTVDNLTLGGVNVQNVTSVADFNLMTLGGLLKSVAAGKMPLNFTINIEAKNPNTGLAAMNKIEWIAIIDSTELTRGIVDQRVEIPAGTTAIVPINIQSDLLQVFKGHAGKSLLNLGLNLAGADGVPSSRLTIKIKPTVLIGTYPLQYPGYIKVSKEFGSQIE